MVKILSQAGKSLADMYDVVGSIAGIDELVSSEVSLVHEMGATLFSERFRTAFRIVGTGLMTQNFNFESFVDTLPEGISRILGVVVLTDDSTRISTLQVSLQGPVALSDFPVFVWDNPNFQAIRHMEAGVALVQEILTPMAGQTLPCFITNGQAEDARELSRLVMRGRTTGFGAGSVFATVLVNFGFTFRAGVSAFGARVPSW